MSAATYNASAHRRIKPPVSKNLFECFLFIDAKTSSNFVEGMISLKRLSPDAKIPTSEPC